MWCTVLALGSGLDMSLAWQHLIRTRTSGVHAGNHCSKEVSAEYLCLAYRCSAVQSLHSNEIKFKIPCSGDDARCAAEPWTSGQCHRKDILSGFARQATSSYSARAPYNLGHCLLNTCQPRTNACILPLVVCQLHRTIQGVGNTSLLLCTLTFNVGKLLTVRVPHLQYR